MVEVLNQVGDITGNDMFNASSAKNIKDAGRNNVEGVLTGFAVMKKTDDETGDTTVSSVMKIDNELYAGGSKVITNRLQELVVFFGDKVLDNGVKIKMPEIATKSGTGVTFILV